MRVNAVNAPQGLTAHKDITATTNNCQQLYAPGHTGTQLPTGWRWAKLGEVCAIIAGQSPPGQTYRKTAEGLPFFQGKADFGIRHPNARKWCTEPNKIAEPGDILISVRAPVGPTNVADVRCCIGRGLAAIRPSEIADRDFVLAALKFYEPDLVKLGSGSTFQAINRDILESHPIPLPPLPEQRRIAAVLQEQLAAVTVARHAVEDQLEAARTIPAAFLRTTFTSPEAQQWPRRRFGDLCDIIAKQVDPKVPEYGALPHVNGENIQSGLCRLTYLRTAKEEGMISGKYLFEAGDVLYSKLRPYLRKALFAEFRGVCSADMYPIRVNPNFLDPHFTAWTLVADEFSDYANEESRRARMPKLNRDQLFAWNMPLPAIPVQRRIVAQITEQITSVENLTRSLADKIAAIEKLPTALLREAFNGRI